MPQASMAKTHLLVRGLSDEDQRFPIEAFPCWIGSAPHCQIVIADQGLSAEQCLLRQRDQSFIVEVPAEASPAFLNGDPVRNAPLRSGDVLQVGKLTLTFFSPISRLAVDEVAGRFGMELTHTGGGGVAAGHHDVDALRSFSLHQEGEETRVGLGQQALAPTQQDYQIFQLYRQAVVSDQLEELAQALLKAISQLMPGLARASLFTHDHGSERLSPFATRHVESKQSFVISQSAFKQVLASRQGVILMPRPGVAQGPTYQRLVLPILHQQHWVGLAHLELKDGAQALPAAIESVQKLLLFAAPHLDTHFLRQEMANWAMETVHVVIQSVDAKDTYTRGHSERVSKYSIAAADELAVSREVKKYLLMSALCHDIGKIGVSDAVLKKPSMLSNDEYEEIKQHPVMGAQILERLPNAQKIISGVRHHHEKWDGTGYPDGLVGEAIPFFARIIAIADAYDAMISGRSYSGFMSEDDAMTRLQDIAELFDGEILQAFFRAHAKGSLSQRTNTVVR